MRHAVLSDVHANLEALEAVLADTRARGADDLVCLGDFVGYGASPNECVALLRPRLSAAVLGNHDEATFDRDALEYFNHEAATAARWTAAALTPEHLAWLRELPRSLAWHGARLVHASPVRPEEWSYVLTAGEALREMAACEESVCFVGHSHFPGTFELDGPHATYDRAPLVRGRRDRRYLIVVPSVGQPRDDDSRAGYLMWDDESWTFEHVRIAYDIAGAQARIRTAGLPPHLADRLQWGQ